jgi:hypothetical protein
MADTEKTNQASPEAIGRAIRCDRTAEFILWDTHDLAREHTDSGAPCGAELPPRNGIRGWEVCAGCLKSPLLRALLHIGAK